MLPNMPDAVLEQVCATSGENTDACNAIGCKQNKTNHRAIGLFILRTDKTRITSLHGRYPRASGGS